MVSFVHWRCWETLCRFGQSKAPLASRSSSWLSVQLVFVSHCKCLSDQSWTRRFTHGLHGWADRDAGINRAHAGRQLALTSEGFLIGWWLNLWYSHCFNVVMMSGILNALEKGGVMDGRTFLRELDLSHSSSTPNPVFLFLCLFIYLWSS